MKTGRRKIFAHFLWLTLALVLSLPAVAQETNQRPVLNRREDNPKTERVNEVVTLKLNSKLMAREMSYNVIFPSGYKNPKESQRRYAVVYLLHGLSGHFDNWATKTGLALYARDYDYIFVMPEGENGWYTDSASENNDRFESYITEELIPEIDKKFRSIAARKYRFVAGLSMGGYGSIKFGLRRPDLFALVGSFSGALGAASVTEKEFGANSNITKSIFTVFGATDSRTRRENDIFQMIREVSPERVKELPLIYLDCGTEDPFYKNNRDFADLLQQKKIPHEFRELPGNHNWAYWDSQLREFLRVSERFLK